jgi:thioredoxin-related protein
MKLYYKFFGSLVFIVLTFVSYTQDESIEWVSINSFVDEIQNNVESKHVFIDVYTEWCGWCKRMDASTFKDPEIVEIMNNYFIPIKFDAEQKEPIQVGDQEYKFVDKGRRGYHELAARLMNGKMSYPTFVLLDDKGELIQPLPGFQTAEDLKPILLFIGQEHYKEKSWEEYLEGTE